MLIIQIQIDKFPKISFNKIYAGVHWSVRRKQAELFHNLIHIEKLDYEKTFHKKLQPIQHYPVMIDYNFIWASKPLDTSNCFYMVKMLEDGLVKNKILKDDSPNFVSVSTVTSSKDKFNSITIKIYDSI
jgi:hypothetical protein